MSIFKGCATALVTPFSDSGVDYDSLGRLIDFQIENDVGALVILGTTGEAATMSENEKIDVVKFSVKAADGRVPSSSAAARTTRNRLCDLADFSRRSERTPCLSLRRFTTNARKAGSSRITRKSQIPSINPLSFTTCRRAPASTFCRKLSENLQKLKTSSPSKKRRGIFRKCPTR